MPKQHGDAELASSRSHVLQYLRRESLDIFNRLHSIAEDAAFVEHVHQAYSTIPLLANLRCGAWYSDPSIAVNIPAYFKSTDGHFSNWSFNLRRANLHLLTLIVEKNGVMLVDSTRAGKRIPDALSKTIPIWCAVINRAVARRFSGALASDWDNTLYTPPGAVSSQEHHQIESLLDIWAEALVQSSFVFPKLPCPLRPLWITPATTDFPSLTTSSRKFLPVICVSASKQIEYGTERRSVGFSYIQGSGDDHELWSMGLTPELFWKHKRDMLEANRAELPRLISSVVSAGYSRDNGNPPSPITRVDGRILICAVSDLSSRELIQTCDFTNIAFLLLTSKDTEQGDVLPAFFSGMTILQIQVTEGKKGQTRFLEDVLPRSVDFVRQQLRGDKRVCVACNSGQDVSVGVALSALQQFFDDEGRYVASELDTPPDKKSIRARLEWIISSRPLANPSRATLKRVNEFFLSSSSFYNSSQSCS